MCGVDWLNYAAKRHLEESPELEDVLVGKSPPHTHTHAHSTHAHSTHTEVERNLAANNLTTLAHWKLFNSFFPLAVPGAPTSKQLNQTESIMYRCVCVECGVWVECVWSVCVCV